MNRVLQLQGMPLRAAGDASPQSVFSTASVAGCLLTTIMPASTASVAVC